MRGTVKDCGCIPENSAKRGPVAEDLTGRRFGKLVAVKNWKVKTAGPGGNAAVTAGICIFPLHTA